MLKEKGFGVPAAIVTAGAIIAVALLFGGEAKSPTAPIVAGGNAPAKEVTLMEMVKDLGIKEKDFSKCTEKSDTVAKVNEDIAGVTSVASQPGFGTPYNLVIDTKTGATIPVVGAQPFTNMKKVIDLILSDDPTVTDLSVDISIPEVTVEGDHINGKSDARIQVVEYSDFECPFCGRFHETMNQVMAEYGESGDVNWIYRHFPLEQIHPNAFSLAVASECVSELGGNDKFWEFSNMIFGK